MRLLREHAALDLLNSVDVHRGKAVDFIDSGASLAAWAAHAELLDEAEERLLIERFERSPEAAAGAVAEVHQLREQLGAELTDHKQTEQLALILDRHLPSPLVRASGDGIAFNAAAVPPEEMLLGRLALQATALLLCVPGHRIRQCQGPDCHWFFLDQSGGRRHWCVMQSCGNAAKARRHRERMKIRA